MEENPLLNQRLMAFWEYDLFPYTLCGEVIEFVGQGRVKVKEYGGSIFNPIVIVPWEEGLEYKKKLQEIEANYKKESEEIHKKYVDQIPFKSKHPYFKRK